MRAAAIQSPVGKSDAGWRYLREITTLAVGLGWAFVRIHGVAVGLRRSPTTAATAARRVD
jgi:hypothetical protein